MKNIDICLAANDVQPSTAFVQLSAELARRSKYTLTAINFAKLRPSFLDPIIVKSCGFVLVGMSSSHELALHELLVLKFAVNVGTSFGLYADVFSAYKRKWFEPFRNMASLLFVMNEAECEEAKLLFPNASVVPSGNPTHETYFDFTMDKESLRSRYLIAPGTMAIFVSGSKHLAINIDLLRATAYAVKDFPTAVILFGRHPGDKNSSQIYNDLADILHPRIIVVNRKELTGSQALCGVNLLVEHTGSLGIEAACKRVPVINYFSQEGLKILIEETGEKEWPPCQHGTSTAIYDSPEALRQCIESGSYRKVISRQEQLYPKRNTKGHAIKIMADTLCGMV